MNDQLSRIAIVICLVFGKLLNSVVCSSLYKAPLFTIKNISVALQQWEPSIDRVVMFTAPWCKYCKQLRPSWDQISHIHSQSRSLAIGVFDCEESEEHKALCDALQVDRYPSLYFIGHGDYYQNKKSFNFKNLLNLGLFERSSSRIVVYDADIYVAAIYDWIRFLHYVSSLKRSWSGFWNWFNQNIDRNVDNLYFENDGLHRKVDLFGSSLEQIQMDKIFDNLEDMGDPFPALYNLVPSEDNLPFRQCVGEMATEYCRLVFFFFEV